MISESQKRSFRHTLTQCNRAIDHASQQASDPFAIFQSARMSHTMLVWQTMRQIRELDGFTITDWGNGPVSTVLWVNEFVRKASKALDADPAELGFHSDGGYWTA